MRNQRLNYIIVGVFVTAMAAAALVAAIVLAGGSIAHDRYMIVLDNVADLKFGTQVRFEGYPVGQVEAIKPRFEAQRTRFQLEVSVKRGWRIPSDSIARIASSNFLGAKTVDIQGGKAHQLLTPGDHIAGAPSADMFAAMSSVAAELGDLSRNDLSTLIARVTALVETANNLVETDLRGVIGSVGGVATKLEQEVPAVTGQILIFTERLNSTLGRMQEILSRGNIDSAQHIVRNIEDTSNQFVVLSENLQGTLDRLDGVFSDVGQVIKANDGKVNAAVEDARYTLRAIATNIDSINHNLAGTARNMNEFSRLIRQNPGLLLDSSPRQEVGAESAAFPSLRARP